MPDVKTAPCPYCGSASTHPLRQVHARGEPFAVVCCRMDTEDTDNIGAECGAQGPYSGSAAGAVTRWNDVAELKADFAALCEDNEDLLVRNSALRADLRRERERAKCWESIAAGRRARVAEAEMIAHGVCEGSAEWEDDCKDAQARVLGQRKAFDAATDEFKDTVARDKARIALLEKTLRFIERVDKTPMYGCKGTDADRNRYNQLPDDAGQRWKTPREMIRDLKLPAEGAQ